LTNTLVARLRLEQTIDEAIFKQNWDAKQKIQEDDGWMLSAKMTLKSLKLSSGCWFQPI